MFWESPHAFWLFLPLALVAAWKIYRRRAQRSSLIFSQVARLRAGRRGLRAHFTLLPNLLRVVALILCVVALARPQRQDIKIKRSTEGIDILVTMDVSDSMLIEDMVPENRLECAKKIIKEFIETRPSDRVGLVVFSGESYTRVPPTLDHGLLLENLSKVKTSENIKMGTAIGVALANAAGRLESSQAKSRVIILLTDGESNTGTIDPLTALEIVKQFGIKVYTVGIGKDGQAQLPRYQKDPLGRVVKTYQPIHSKVNDQLLTRLAEETGGKYFRTNLTQQLDNAFKEINQLEKSKIDTNQIVKLEEHFENVVAAATGFLALAFLLSQTLLARLP